MALVLETVLRRWYVVVFLVAYVWASSRERGWKATVRFAALAFGLAFAAEYSSTRNGFPFTHYDYTGKTRGDEVYLSNVPLFVPASYAVMIYAGRSLGIRLARRTSALSAVVAGAVCTVALDVVVDPVAVRGSQWFLGDLFHYAPGGPLHSFHWFGVPFGNFGGWLLVAAAVIGIDLVLGRRRPEAPAVRGVLLAGGVLAFDAGVGLAIGATVATLSSIAVALALLAGVRTLARSDTKVGT